MKKAAIMTWFHYHNYGTALQVTALYNVISSFGYDVDVIRYLPNVKAMSRPMLHRIAHAAVKRIIRSKNRRFKDIGRDQKFCEFIDNQLTFTNGCITQDDFESLNGQYDYFVCGSDQIWAPTIFDSHYFLDFVTDDSKKIAYAPSIGLSVIENKNVEERMKNLISSFSYLSVREKQGAAIIRNLCSENARVVLDPTLLLACEQWQRIIPTVATKENYILCYFLGTNDNARKHVVAISAKLKLPVKILPVFTKDSKYGELVKGVGPMEFLSLIQNAAFVCTDSYHGAVFSIINQKPFYVFERFHGNDKQSQNSRVYNLLETTHLEDRLVRFGEPVEKNYAFSYDCFVVEQFLNMERESSINFLKEALDHE